MNIQELNKQVESATYSINAIKLALQKGEMPD